MQLKECTSGISKCTSNSCNCSYGVFPRLKMNEIPQKLKPILAMGYFAGSTKPTSITSQLEAQSSSLIP